MIIRSLKIEYENEKEGRQKTNNLIIIKQLNLIII